MKQVAIALGFTLCTAPLLTHCSGDGDDDVVDIRDGGVVRDGGEVRDSGVRRDAGPRRDAGFRDAGVSRDNNDDFATATMAMLNTQDGRNAVINPAGDRDFYKFEAIQGQFLLLFTTTGAVNGTTTDPVIRLYDSTETMVAQNNTRVTSNDTDPEIIYHVPADGTYYVEVLEWSDWSTDSPGPEGGRDYLYTLFLRTLSDRNVGSNLDLETGDDAASGIDIEFNDNDFAYVYGTFDGRSNDVDYFNVSLNRGGMLRMDLMPPGPTGYGSTYPGGHLVVIDNATSSVAADLNLETLRTARVPIYPGNFTVYVTHEGLGVGANDFYVFKTFLLNDNAPAPPEPNDTFATASALTLEGTPTRAAFILTELTAGDVDYFSFDVLTGEQPSAACGAEGSGSGVRGLTVEIFDTMEMSLGMDVEDAPSTAFVPQMPSTPGLHYVKLSKTGQAPGVDGVWVRCGIRSGPP